MSWISVGIGGYFKIHDPAAYHDTDTQKYCCSLQKDKLPTIKKKCFVSARDNFGKFIHHYQTENKTLIKKLDFIKDLNKII